jgi:hypothetical protein
MCPLHAFARKTSLSTNYTSALIEIPLTPGTGLLAGRPVRWQIAWRSCSHLIMSREVMLCLFLRRHSGCRQNQNQRGVYLSGRLQAGGVGSRASRSWRDLVFDRIEAEFPSALDPVEPKRYKTPVLTKDCRTETCHCKRIGLSVYTPVFQLSRTAAAGAVQKPSQTGLQDGEQLEHCHRLSEYFVLTLFSGQNSTPMRHVAHPGLSASPARNRKVGGVFGSSTRKSCIDEEDRMRH